DILDRLGVKVTEHPEMMQAVRLESEQVKIRLSDQPTTTATIDLPTGTYHRDWSRQEMESAVVDLIEKTMAPCRMALRDAGLTPEQIDEVVLVGGSTRMPLVRLLVKELFGREPHCEINPDEVVALGAAVQADILGGHTKE